MRTRPTNPAFAELFGQSPQLTLSVPGRVNLMGDHTDYNRGYVLPTRIPQETRVEISLTLNQRVRLFSVEMDDEPHNYMIGQERPTGGWIDYVQGLTCVLSQEGFPLQGFDLKIASDVPVGSGLSSSAALEMAVLKALRELLNLPLKDIQLARIGQLAENDFVGAPVGILDQMACLLAVRDQALFIDTRDLSFRSIPLPQSLELVVIDSGIVHRHAEGDYGIRRDQCMQAARRLMVDDLSQLSPTDLSKISELPEPLNRRARHVVTENARVLETIKALEADEQRALRRLFYESHRSLSEDYQSSRPEIDSLIEQCKTQDAIIGARITGGGFGGCVVALVRKPHGYAAARRVIESYRLRFNRDAKILIPVV